METQYTAALEAVTTYGVDGNRLTLRVQLRRDAGHLHTHGLTRRAQLARTRLFRGLCSSSTSPSCSSSGGTYIANRPR